MAVKGNDIIILKDNTAIAGTQSHRIQNMCGVIEKASSSQQAYKEFIADRKEWTVTVNYLVLTAADILKTLEVGTTVTLLMKDRDGTKTLSGSAIITAIDTQYQRGTLARGTYTFKGTGALT